MNIPVVCVISSDGFVVVALASKKLDDKGAKTLLRAFFNPSKLMKSYLDILCTQNTHLFYYIACDKPTYSCTRGVEKLTQKYFIQILEVRKIFMILT